MKTLKTILTSILLVLISVSCSKDDASDEKELNPKLIGTWRFTEVLSSGGFTVVTDYFIEFKANGEANEWFGTSSNPVNNLTTAGWFTKGNNVVFFNLQTKVENSVPFSITTDGKNMVLNGNNRQVYEKL